MEKENINGEDVMNKQEQIESMGKRITAAMEIITRYGGIDGSHHKQWCLDQIARTLLSEEDYEKWVKSLLGEYDLVHCEWEYEEWDEGIAP